MSLTAAVWPQFATQVFRGGIRRFTCIGSYVNKQVTTFTFRAQATTCSKHHTRTVMDAGCECGVDTVHHEYGRLTLATAGLLLLLNATPTVVWALGSNTDAAVLVSPPMKPTCTQSCKPIQ